MKNFSTKTIIISVIGLLLVLWVWSSYNSLVKASVAVDTQWAQVETVYQRRFDLIPNLVASVQGVMKQETAIFTAIAEARTRYSGATTPDAKAAAAGQVESALGRLLVITENYPTLKSSETVQTLMAQLEGTENRISVERSRFNETASAYNLMTRTFPKNLVAKIFGFDAKSLFQSQTGADSAPKVNL